jgi:hypothetical protein
MVEDSMKEMNNQDLFVHQNHLLLNLLVVVVVVVEMMVIW